MRGKIFTAVEKLKGGGIISQLQEIEQLLLDTSAPEEDSGERLAGLLRHACLTTSYYRQFSGLRRLEDFPVISKKTVRENYEGFFSSSYDRHRLVSVLTSGSYGTPFTFYITPEKYARQRAEVIYFARWTNYEVGNRHIFLRATENFARKSVVSLFMQNQVVLNPVNQTGEWYERQRELMKKKRIANIIGFPSVIGPLAMHCLAAGDGPGDYCMKGITMIGEPLREPVRETTEKLFGCPVLSRYAAEELGVLAHECPTRKKHHLNPATYVIELLSADSDKPVSPGEPGRVVVTDLFSHAMPLIRYETGDIAVLSPESCGCGLNLPVLERVEGRSVEMVYSTCGTAVSPYTVSCAMQDIEDVVQFQFVQEDNDSYTMKLCTLPGFNREKLIMDRLKELFGRDSSMKIEYVSSISPLPSGKRPYVINRCQRIN